jgi:hypothetical protein
MVVPFDTLENSARVWIYQSGRKLTEVEKHTISEALSTFTETWVAHGNPLKTSFKIFYDQFIVLAADESFNEASGCSIDGSVRVMKQIDEQYRLNLFDRTNVAFKKDSIEVINLNNLSKTLGEGVWQSDTLVFNNVITTKGELEKAWILPAGQTWLKRYLTKIAV